MYLKLFVRFFSLYGDTRNFKRKESFCSQKLSVKIMTPLKNNDVDELYRAILSLENEEECALFFEDLCTINEIISLSQRLSVAKKLDEGKTFTTITSETGASSATIGRVNRCLSYGNGGYKNIIEKLKGGKSK